MATNTLTPAQQAGAILQTFLGQLGGDALVAAKGMIVNFGNNIQATPSAQNVVAQAMAIAATAPLQLPNLESEAIKQLGAAVVQLAGLIPNAP